MKIRHATPGEAETLTALALRSKAWWGYADEFMRACRDELSVDPALIGKPHLHYRLAELGGRIAGYYALDLSPDAEPELDALFVEPARIGAGVGGALLADALALARRCGASTLLVESDPNAEPFYCAAGALLIGRRESGSVAGRFLPLLRFQLADDPVAPPGS